MKINSQTKISWLIKHNIDAIDAIAAINPLFKKLKNPILRKVLAPRVTIGDAARIGKCKVEEFFEVLSAIGFTYEEEQQQQAIEGPTAEENTRVKEVINSGNVKTLDVRPFLEKDTDPFNHIMAALKKLPEGYALEVINSFEPTPIIKILHKKGYVSLVRTDDNVVKTYFLKVAKAIEKGGNTDDFIFNVSIDELESERLKYKDQCTEIDVRDLEMPLPMVTVLNELEDLPDGHALFVHHKKVPQYLLPELEERKLKSWIAKIDEENVKLLIHM